MVCSYPPRKSQDLEDYANEFTSHNVSDAKEKGSIKCPLVFDICISGRRFEKRRLNNEKARSKTSLALPVPKNWKDFLRNLHNKYSLFGLLLVAQHVIKSNIYPVVSHVGYNFVHSPSPCMCINFFYWRIFG